MLREFGMELCSRSQWLGRERVERVDVQVSAPNHLPCINSRPPQCSLISLPPSTSRPPLSIIYLSASSHPYCTVDYSHLQLIPLTSTRYPHPPHFHHEHDYPQHRPVLDLPLHESSSIIKLVLRTSGTLWAALFLSCSEMNARCFVADSEHIREPTDDSTNPNLSVPPGVPPWTL